MDTALAALPGRHRGHISGGTTLYTTLVIRLYKNPAGCESPPGAGDSINQVTLVGYVP